MDIAEEKKGYMYSSFSSKCLRAELCPVEVLSWKKLLLLLLVDRSMDFLEIIYMYVNTYWNEDGH